MVLKLVVAPLLLTVRGYVFSSRRRHTRWNCDWSSDVCSSDLEARRTVAQQEDCPGRNRIRGHRRASEGGERGRGSLEQVSFAYPGGGCDCGSDSGIFERKNYSCSQYD